MKSFWNLSKIIHATCDAICSFESIIDQLHLDMALLFLSAQDKFLHPSEVPNDYYGANLFFLADRIC